MNAIRQYQILIDELKDDVLSKTGVVDLKILRRSRNYRTRELNNQKRKQYERTDHGSNRSSKN
jgi:hypothetical protein